MATIKAHLVGLARVSGKAQDDQLQLDALDEAGCRPVFTGPVSSRKPVEERKPLVDALDYLQTGDTLCVWKLDRLGRSTREILNIAEDLHSRGIGLRILTDNLAGDYQPTGSGKLFFTILAAFAEFERDMIRARTVAGLAAARRKGNVGGRPCVLDDDKRVIMHARRAKGESPAAIAKVLGVSRSTVYAALAAQVDEA